MDLIGVLLLVLILANATIYIWFLSKFFDGILFYFLNSKGP